MKQKIRQQSKDWFDKVLELKPGECLHIPVPDKKEQKLLENEFKTLKERYTMVDESFASQLIFAGTYHDGLRWLKVTRSNISPNVAILIHSNGTKEKIELQKSS